MRPLHIKNAHIWDHIPLLDAIVKGPPQRDLYTANGRIIDHLANGTLEVDLDGYMIFPGLINAHDHLELNHYPRSKFRDVYDNAHQWGEDMNVRLDTEPYKSLRTYPLEDRLFIGGLKNLLCGATTVAHHNPPHKALFRKDFPVRVLKKYGWAHSLHFNTDAEIVESYRKTPKDWPWFIHLAEGTDEVAAGEYQRLRKLGCLALNTIPIHGVGLTIEDIAHSHSLAGEYSAGHGSQLPVIWCPTTNIYLLGKTGHRRMGWNTHLLLGSDSRLTAEGDLLDEMRFVSEYYDDSGGIFPIGMFAVSIATGTNFRWHWKLKDSLVGLRDEKCADIVVISFSDNPTKDLCNSRRADLALVVRDGIPQIGNPDIMAKFPHIQTVAATLDGVPKTIHIDLARRIHQCTLKEPGLEVDALPNRRFFLF